MSNICFDFGKKPVTDGYKKVLWNSLYTPEKGWGIDHTAEAVERTKGEKELNRDYLLFAENKFTVDLKNGKYTVRVSSGDYDDEGDVVTKAKVNGTELKYWIHDSDVVEKIIDVDVTDGKMVFEFKKGRHVCLNSIEIAPKQDIEIKNLKVSIKAKRNEQSVSLSWDKAEGVMGYRVERKNLQNREKDRIEDVITESFIDEDVNLCEKYEYTVSCLYGNKFCSIPNTVSAEIVDGGKIKGEISNLDARETGNSVTLIWDGIKEAVWYNIYQKAPYGIYKLIGTSEDCAYIDDEVTTNVPFVYAVEAVTESGISKRAEVVTDIEADKKKKKMETLNRSLVAMKVENGVFLSWRLNAWEYEMGIDFVLFRNGERITGVISNSTNYLDADGKAGDVYTVKAVYRNKMEKKGYSTEVVTTPYIPIPLDKPADYVTPDGNVYPYTANDASAADLDGDGEYEIILRWDANGKDNSHKGYTGECILDAYKLNGKKLWRINLGKNIRSGQHYTQFMVYDFNSDGKAELVCKTADGTVDGRGNVIGDADADYRNKDGFIIEGPEYLTLFNGETGEIMDTVDYDPPRGNVREWGDSWGNRVDRFLACVAYLDGENPSVVMCRGYYDHGCPTNIVAYDVIDDKLVKRWKFLANSKQNIEYTNQGNHNLAVGDIDGDGLDEIVYGAMAVDHDGKGIYSTGFEHGDCMNLGNFTPDTPNLDFFQIHEEETAPYGYEVRDPATGEVKWGYYTGRDTTRGLCAKIDPRYRGNQCWVMDDAIYTMDGKMINEKGPESINFAIWWDGDLIRELLDHEFDEEKGVGAPKIYKWDYENNKLITILDPAGTLSNNWKKGTPCLQADILGDWREEAIWRNEDDTELRIYTTTEITEHKFYTLMHDPVYRTYVAYQNSAYNQCPQTGFYIGPEMEKPPVPEIQYVNGINLPDFTEDIEE